METVEERVRNAFNRLLESVLECKSPFGSEDTSFWTGGQRLRRRSGAEAYLANVAR